jgi:hypothetical protein
VITRLVQNTIGRERIDLDALETSLRDSMHQVGAKALGHVLDAAVQDAPTEPPTCEHGHRLRSAGIRPKRLLTILGPVMLHRQYFHDSQCHHGCYREDRRLDIEHTMFSPGMRNFMAYVGAQGPFAEGSNSLARLAGLTVPAKSIERLCRLTGTQVEAFRWLQAEDGDLRVLRKGARYGTLYLTGDGTGFPVLKRETAGRKGKGADGTAKTREAKVGCVFTQTRLNEEGCPVRDEASTSYIGACETAGEFGDRLYHEAQVRGLAHARQVVMIGDGASWIWNMTADHFPYAIQIIDLYHAREHYGAVAHLVFPVDSADAKAWKEKREKELDAGDVSAVISALAQLQPQTEAARAERDSAIGYFRQHAQRMQYAEFRRMGLFVGSGVVEAGCRTVVGQRLKQSGMHWTVRSADAIMALRCLNLSGLWDEFWESRAAA